MQLLNQTESELHQQEDNLTGEIGYGAGVSSASPYMMNLIADFQRQYPDVSFHLFDGDGDILRRQLDEGY